MKKIFFLIGVLLFANFNAQAKKSAQKTKFHYGIRLSGNVSKLTGEDKYDRIFSEKIGYAAGIATKYDLSNTLSIRADLLYQNIGTNVKNDVGGDLKFAKNNIAVPVLIAYNFAPKFYGETGAELTFNLSAKVKNKEGLEVADWKIATKPFNILWAVGLGYNLTNQFTVNTRFNLGLISPFTDSPGTTRQTFRLHHLDLGIIYFFQ